MSRAGYLDDENLDCGILHLLRVVHKWRQVILDNFSPLLPPSIVTLFSIKVLVLSSQIHWPLPHLKAMTSFMDDPLVPNKHHRREKVYNRGYRSSELRFSYLRLPTSLIFITFINYKFLALVHAN